MTKAKIVSVELSNREYSDYMRNRRKLPKWVPSYEGRYTLIEDTWHKVEKIYVEDVYPHSYFDGSSVILSNFLSSFTEAAKGLEGPVVLAKAAPYDEGCIELYVSGTRLATEEELYWIEDKLKQLEKREEEYRQREVQNFLANHPELEVKPKGK